MSRRSAHAPLATRTLVSLALITLVVQVVLLTVMLTSLREPTITGKATTSAGGTVSFVFITSSVCTVPLQYGWTLISLCANESNQNISSVLSGIDYRYVMRWNHSSQSFDIFSPLSTTNPFTTFEFNTSYFVNLNSASATIPLTGQNVSDLNISLGQGWNGPGYPYQFSANITRYFNESVHRFLMKWNASNQTFLIYSPRTTTPEFTTIDKGQGQMLNSNANDILRYNTTRLQEP